MSNKPITADQIRETYKRHRLQLLWAAKLPECKRLCAGWHSHFGACLVLDDDRLRALCRRLVDDQFSYNQLAWAIEAYAEFCEKDQWHREHPEARRTLASFMRDERLEQWIENGERLKDRRKTAKTKAAERSRVNELEEAWLAKTMDQREALLQRAVSELKMQARPKAGTINHGLLMNKVFQLLQRELKERQREPTTVGEMI